ncbi:hypothetical protein BDK51DRAFT_30829, partial [Blyttiomyces helicus]
TPALPARLKLRAEPLHPVAARSRFQGTSTLPCQVPIPGCWPCGGRTRVIRTTIEKTLRGRRNRQGQLHLPAPRQIVPVLDIGWGAVGGGRAKIGTTKSAAQVIKGLTPDHPLGEQGTLQMVLPSSNLTSSERQDLASRELINSGVMTLNYTNLSLGFTPVTPLGDNKLAAFLQICDSDNALAYAYCFGGHGMAPCIAPLDWGTLMKRLSLSVFCASLLTLQSVSSQ